MDGGTATWSTRVATLLTISFCSLAPAAASLDVVLLTTCEEGVGDSDRLSQALAALRGADTPVSVSGSDLPMSEVLALLGEAAGLRLVGGDLEGTNDLDLSQPRPLRDVLLEIALRRGYAYRVEGGETLVVLQPAVTGADATDTPPRVLEKVKPVYPEEARRARATGRVILRTIVCEDGSARVVASLRSHPLLLGSARRAVEQWRFEPGTRQGVARPTEMAVAIDYTVRAPTSADGPPPAP